MTVPSLSDLARDLDLDFTDASLLERALTHRSFLNENPAGGLEDNERLEFLGDAVLDFVVGEYLYHRFPGGREGQLTSLRAALVRAETLARFARQIQLGRYLRLGRGEAESGGRRRPALLCSGFEALIGALYLDHGIELVTSFVLRFVQPAIPIILAEELNRDAKSQLQEWSQGRWHLTPTYWTVGERGPDHAKEFTVEVVIGDEVYGQGQGSNKQAAEQARWVHAHQEAIAFYRRALALVETAPPKRRREGWQLEMAAQLHEGLGDVLEWTGEHDEAQMAYRGALADVPKGDGIWQARLHRKSGNIGRLQRRYEQALQAYDLAETTLGPAPAESAPAWWQEWVQIQLERMWLYYWLGQWREISELADQVRPTVEQHGTPSQRISFFLSLASMYSRRDRYAVSEETLAFCQTALAISLESENLSEIAWARFMLGFNQLWAGDLDGAEKQM